MTDRAALLALLKETREWLRHGEDNCLNDNAKWEHVNMFKRLDTAIASLEAEPERKCGVKDGFVLMPKKLTPQIENAIDNFCHFEEREELWHAILAAALQSPPKPAVRCPDCAGPLDEDMCCPSCGNPFAQSAPKPGGEAKLAEQEKEIERLKAAGKEMVVASDKHFERARKEYERAEAAERERDELRAKLEEANLQLEEIGQAVIDAVPNMHDSPLKRQIVAAIDAARAEKPL